MNDEAERQFLEEALFRIRALRDGYIGRLERGTNYLPSYRVTLHNRVTQLQADELRLLEWLREA